jgi:hypothetical protein
MPKKVGAATANLAGKPDNRTAPYTVPMKVVPRQCGTAGTRPSSTAASVVERGLHGRSRAPVPVRTLPRAGRAVQPLRPWQSLLRPAVPAPGAAGGSARERTSLPTVPAGPAGPRRAVAALAPTLPCWRWGWRWRRPRQWWWPAAERDAPGLPTWGGGGSTGRMDTPHHPGARACGPGGHRTGRHHCNHHCDHHHPSRHHPGGRHRDHPHDRHDVLAVPALCQASARLGAPGLPASWPAPHACRVAP